MLVYTRLPHIQPYTFNVKRETNGKKYNQHKRADRVECKSRKNTFKFLQYNFAASLSWLEFSKEKI